MISSAGGSGAASGWRRFDFCGLGRRRLWRAQRRDRRRDVCHRRRRFDDRLFAWRLRRRRCRDRKAGWLRRWQFRRLRRLRRRRDHLDLDRRQFDHRRRNVGMRIAMAMKAAWDQHRDQNETSRAAPGPFHSRHQSVLGERTSPPRPLAADQGLQAGNRSRSSAAACIRRLPSLRR